MSQKSTPDEKNNISQPQNTTKILITWKCVSKAFYDMPKN
jgi:hypothetical protein